jgi:prepilin-type N-terminal cleavage/methylation domain-containing protein
MHPLARNPAREARLNRQTGSRAFTLIELLTVIAIIAILASITFGVMQGVNERAAINRAKAELASLALSLESYKKQYGDYPRSGAAANVATTETAAATDAPGILFNALTGKLGPYNAVTNSAASIDGKSFVEISKFSIQDTVALPTVGNTTPMANAFLDPWGRRYLYYYKTGTPAQWIKPSYILLSVGPSVATSGAPEINVNIDGTYTVETTADAADNIYANK